MADNREINLGVSDDLVGLVDVGFALAAGVACHERESAEYNSVGGAGLCEPERVDLGDQVVELTVLCGCQMCGFGHGRGGG